VAAPVYTGGGAVVAALSVSGPGTRLTPPRIAEVAAACMTQARALSAVLGHRPGGAAPSARAKAQREGAA
jgi:DNA-binding IclR family transcriptional regulator